MSNVEIYYFQNQVGAYVWENRNATKILFYINSLQGNSSVRCNIIKKFQLFFPYHTIIQFDLPGSGISYHLDATMDSISFHLSEAIQEYLEQYPEFKSRFSIFTENESSIIGSRLLLSLLEYNLQPSHMIHLNPSTSIINYFFQRYPKMLIPIFLPILIVKNTKMISIHNQFMKKKEKHDRFTQFHIITTKSFVENSNQVYLELDATSPLHKKWLGIYGEGITSLILKQNVKKLQSFFTNNIRCQ